MDEDKNEYMILNVKVKEEVKEEKLSELEKALPKDKTFRDGKRHFDPPEFGYTFDHALTREEVDRITAKVQDLNVIWLGVLFTLR